MQTRLANRSTLNQLEKSLRSKDLQIHGLQARLAEATISVQDQTRKLQEQISLNHQSNRRIENLERDKKVLQDRVNSFKELLQAKEQQYHELFKVSVEGSQPIKNDLVLIQKQFSIEMMLLQTKLEMKQSEIVLLNKALESKNEGFAAVLAENAELKKRELLLVGEYNSKIRELRTPTESLELPQVKDISPDYCQMVNEVAGDAFEEILALKEQEIEELRQAVDTNRKEVSRLMGELAEIRNAEPPTRDVLYRDLVVEHATYKRLYEKAKSELQELEMHIPELEQFRDRLTGYVKQNQILSAQERHIQQLSQKLAETKRNSVHSENHTQQENVRLRNREDELSVRICELESVIGKYDKAFRIMNPYFGVYGYDMTEMTGDEIQIVKQLQMSKSLALRANQFEAEKANFASEKSLHREERIRFEQQIHRLRSEVAEQKEINVMNFQRVAEKKEGSLRNACIQIVSEVVDKLKPLQETYRELQLRNHELEVQLFSAQQGRHAKVYVLTGPETFSNTVAQVNVQQITLPDSSNYVEAIGKLQTEIRTLRSTTFEMEKTIANYEHHFQSLQTKTIQLRRSLELAKEQQKALQKTLQEKNTLIEDLNKRITQVEHKTPAVLSSNAETVVNITDLGGRESVSEESVKQLSSLIDSNIELVGRMEQEYSSLKDRYTKVLSAVLYETANDTAEVPGEAASLRKKLAEAILRLDQADLNEKNIQQENELLRSQNTRLRQEIQSAKLDYQKEQALHQQRTHALEEELDTHLKHREHILLKNYTPGLETATDSKMVGSLMELIRDKNARIEVLEQRMLGLSRQTDPQSFASINKNIFVGVQDNLSDLLERAAHMIQSLQLPQQHSQL